MVSFAHVKSLAIVVGLIGAIGCAKEEIRLLDLNDRRFDFWNAGEKSVRVFVFTRSDCPVSNRYAPEVRKLYESFHPRGVDFYLIYVDSTEKPETIRTHLKEFDYPCPALRDPEHTLVAYTQATVTPEAVFFAGDGRMTYRGRISDLYADLGNARSAATSNDLHDAIEATLNGRSVAEPVTEAVGCYISDLK
jgi:hypothetical protein